MPVQREHRRYRGLARLLILDGFLAARAVDQRMNGLGVDRPLAAQNLRRLSGKGRKLHVAVDLLGEMARKCRLAGAGIAEEPEQWAVALPEPVGNRLQRLVLLIGKLHADNWQDSHPQGKRELRAMALARGRTRPSAAKPR